MTNPINLKCFDFPMWEVYYNSTKKITVIKMDDPEENDLDDMIDYDPERQTRCRFCEKLVGEGAYVGKKIGNYVICDGCLSELNEALKSLR